MRYDSDATRDFMPPNDPWEEHDASEDAQSYLTLYYCEDDISKYPVREVTKVNDNKSDPNLETVSYGLCSTCTRDIRSGLVKNDRPYLFFCTNYNGDRDLVGYYHIGWHSLGWPLLTNYRDGSIQDDYRLVADEMHWVYPPISFKTVSAETGFNAITSGFRKKLVGPDRTADLLALLHDREDYSDRYIEEIRRLELINKRYLEPHPIILPEDAPEEMVEELAEDITETREQITDLEYKTGDVRNYLPDYEQSSLVLDLADSISLSGDDYRQGPIRKDTKMDVETAKKVYQVVMKQNHKMGFNDERVRDFVFEMLKAQDRRLTRSEVMQMETPSRDDLIELMDEYRGDQERIGEVKEEFDKLCDELDELVLHEMYGLDESSEKVVDEFLEVW